jgi:hypothetical protein
MSELYKHVLPEDRLDVACEIRIALRDKGVSFDGVTWRETEEIVEHALREFRQEIKRLREVIRKSAAQAEPQGETK